MKKFSERQPRVLAIDPFVEGVGFTLFDGPLILADWGLCNAKKDKNRVCATKVDELIARYEPDILVMEDCEGKGSRRGKRVRRLLHTIGNRAKEQGLETRRYSRGQMLECFAPFGLKTKFEIAKRFAVWFPDLELFLPKATRNPWESEKPNMALFDAAALMVTYVNDIYPDTFPNTKPS